MTAEGSNQQVRKAGSAPDGADASSPLIQQHPELDSISPALREAIDINLGRGTTTSLGGGGLGVPAVIRRLTQVLTGELEPFVVGLRGSF